MKVALAAVGTPAAAMTSLANAFDASSCAAAALGPTTARPSARSRSASPAASGASGPIDDHVDAQHVGCVGDAIDVVGGDGKVVGKGSRAGIAGRGMEHRIGVFAAEGVTERVLPPSATDDQNPHRRWAARNASAARSAARFAASATADANSRASPA